MRPPLGDTDTNALDGGVAYEAWAAQERATSLVPTVEQFGLEHPDVYAGIYYRNGHLYVGFTESAEENLAQLRLRVRHPEILRHFNANYTYAVMTQTLARVTADMPSLRNAGILVTGLGIDEVCNRVAVTLARRDERHEAELRRRYGDMVFYEGGWSPATA